MKLLEIGLRFGRLSAAIEAVKLPAILADMGGRQILRNAAADGLFEEPHVIGIESGGRLNLRSTAETRNLLNAIESAASQRVDTKQSRALEIVVNNHLEGPRLALSILALGNGPGAVLVIAREFSPARISLDALQLAFGLTPAETRLTGLLANGLSLKDAAQTLGVSYWTVMTQVKCCYQKTGTHRQAELVALALNIGAARA